MLSASVIGFKLALISKGLRRLVPIDDKRSARFKLALISKGLRLVWQVWFPLFARFKLALISKGLRLSPLAQALHCSRFQACPDFKGIKTVSVSAATNSAKSFKLALISKGLRRFAVIHTFTVCVSSLP